jgi:hypothetical protein
MTQVGKKVVSHVAARSPKDLEWVDLLSYKAMALGVGLLVTITILTKVVISWKGGPPSESASLERGPLVSEQVDEVENHRAPQQESLAAATPSDPVDRSSPGSLDELTAMKRLSAVLAQAGPREQATAAALMRFAASGAMEELRSLDRQDVVSLADYLAGELSPSQVQTLLRQTLGFSGDAVLTEENVSSSLVDIYDAVAGNRVGEVRPSPLMVTDGADADGRIIGKAHTLPVGTKRIYAVFENAHALEGLDQVLAVWRDPNDDQLVFTEFEPVRQGSAYNYVWLDVESGWPEGRYQVELFHPEAQSLLLASEGFSVR